MAEVKHLVESWRSLKEQLRVQNEALDEARAALTAEDSEHVRAVSQWDEQRTGLNKAVAEIKRSAAADGARATAAQRDADTAMAAAIEQRSRNEEHRAKLSAHLRNLQSEAARIEVRDAATAQQLLSFRIERERCRSQLVQAIQKLQDTVPMEREATAQAIRAASARTTEARHALEADAKAWAALVAKRRRTQHARIVEAVDEEAAAAAEARQRAKAMRTAIQAGVAEADGLLARIRKTRGSLRLEDAAVMAQ